MVHVTSYSERDPPPPAETFYVPKIVATLAAVFGGLAMRPISAFDFWWHLSMGRATVEAVARVFPEPIGLAAADTYRNVEWLFDVVLFGLHGLGGFAAINLFVAVLAAASFLLCWKVASRLCGPQAPWTALTLTCLVVGAAHLRFAPRPQAVFLVFLPLALFLGLRVHRAFRSSALGLVALFAVWAQTHASVVIAPFVVFAAMLTGGAGQGSLQAWKNLRLRHGVLLAGLVALTLTSAHGIGIVTLVVGHTDPDVIRHVQEMRPFRFSELSFTPNILSLLFLLAAAVSGAVSHRRLPLWPTMLLVLGMAMAANSVRFLAALAYLALPLAATVWSRRTRVESRVWVALGLLATVAVPSSLYWRSGAPSLSIHRPNFPIQTTEALQRLGFEGPLFNTYVDGGYLGWKLYGDARVVIDGRTQVLFNGEEFYAARTADDDKTTFDALNRIHGFGAAVIPKDKSICLELVADPVWSTVWVGERESLFMPSGRAPHHLRGLSACRDEMHSVVPCRESGQLDLFLAEVETARALSPGSAYLARLGAELALQCMPRPDLERAQGFLETGASSEPDHPDYAWLKAYMSLARRQPEEALSAVQDVTLDHLRSQVLRLRVLKQLGRDQEAADLGRKVADHHDDHTPADVRDLVATACESIGDRRCAVRHALRAALDGFEPAKARLRSYLDRGWVPEEHERLARGACH
ncbi:MAG: hypothetical protein MPN21_04095 [Thermoanaerobaculia bacterium]|nr:hypothetical protein [Thermoanaerobaculia bacterium]